MSVKKDGGLKIYQRSHNDKKVFRLFLHQRQENNNKKLLRKSLRF